MSTNSQLLRNLYVLSVIAASSFSVSNCGLSENQSSRTSESNLSFDSDAKIRDVMNQLEATTELTDRIEKASRLFLETPYSGMGPLGEGDVTGPGNEAKPLYRADMFDCTTFVETVLAIAQSHDFAEFKLYINRVRYKNGEVGFLTRNHMPEADWIANNSRMGILRDITSESSVLLGPSVVTDEVIHVSKKDWFAMKGLATSFAPQNVPLLYIPTRSILKESESIKSISSDYQKREAEFRGRIKAAPSADEQLVIRNEWRELLAQIDMTQVIQFPEETRQLLKGSVVNFVTPNDVIKQDNLSTEIGIGHQVLIIENDNRLFVRDASKNFGKVAAIPFENYLLLKLNSSTQLGINVQKVVAQSLGQLLEVE